MFDIGFTELALIAIIALLVVGPERLPTVARSAGLLFGRFRRFALSVKADIDHELNLEQVRKYAEQAENSELHEIIEDTGNELKGSLSALNEKPGRQGPGDDEQQ